MIQIPHVFRFYDNQQDMINQFQAGLKRVESILVDNNDNKFILNGKSPHEYNNNFLEKYPDNTYAKYLKEIGCTNSLSRIGFSKKDVEDIKRWCKNKKDDNKTVLFDWDGTLSVIEGIYLAQNIRQYGRLYDKIIRDVDIAIYCCGGITRFCMLRKMFTYLRRHNVAVYILTNNPVASVNLGTNQEYAYFRIHFYRVVKEIIPNISINNILSGYDTGCFKPQAFFNNEYLRNSYYENLSL